jgi:hypothetical protein
LVISVKKANMAVLILGAAIAAGGWYGSNRFLRPAAKPWNSIAFQARYVDAQLREVDPQHASLVLTYEVRNDTDTDYRLANASGFVLMSRLKSDHSLSSEQNVRLSYATFLPAKQESRVALEIRQPFSWPAKDDPLLRGKLGNFVRQNLANVEGYVLFDEINRCEIAFPSGWRELQLASELETD